MALYIVTAVAFDATGEVEFVRWLPAAKAKNVLPSDFDIATVEEVVAAIDRGDVVEMRFEGPFGPTSGGVLRNKLLGSGRATLVEAALIPGRALPQLPRI